MDRINRALLGVEENGELIRSIRKTVDGINALDAAVLDGTETAQGMTFGTVKVTGHTAALVLSGGNAALCFCGNAVAVCDGGTAAAMLPTGYGELTLSGVFPHSRVMLVGRFTAE